MVTLTVSNSVADEVGDMIGEGLDAYNAGEAGPYGEEALWVVARDAAGAVQAGLKGKIEYSWLFVDWLWVSPARRRSGLGSRLLEKGEEVAREKGCIGAFLGSFTFQAPDFYKRQGYEEFGRLADFPPGHEMVWLKKSL
ncbi:GNAT family N-acetyltransferase [Mesorhizobium sp. L-8-3]|uniref:GNAT family N-acetyltransferase n=1 Tax=Mesorhizobium sp. L-8-3 TaxID=2744522 RepID=UPI001926985F|nr:GNAT family N-acetyltransferase [Mesorhizobium sp. L-8-3]BCH25737.1 N-acetyltransferase [Mesorhizobium sp. L-8-3]